MANISIESIGNFEKTDRFFKRMSRGEIYRTVDKYARQGVSALASATPKDTGETAASWNYSVRISRGGCTIEWTNSHMGGSTPVAILLQYGHGTGTGGYVQGRDFINPAIRPVFDDIAANVWKAVTSA